MSKYRPDPITLNFKAEARHTKLTYAKQNIKNGTNSISIKSNYNILILKNVSIQLTSI